MQLNKTKMHFTPKKKKNCQINQLKIKEIQVFMIATQLQCLPSPITLSHQPKIN